jgi:hypothetical protein
MTAPCSLLYACVYVYVRCDGREGCIDVRCEADDGAVLIAPLSQCVRVDRHLEHDAEDVLDETRQPGIVPEVAVVVVAMGEVVSGGGARSSGGGRNGAGR